MDDWHRHVVTARNIRQQSKVSYGFRVNQLKRLYGGIPIEDLRPGRIQRIVNSLAAEQNAYTYAILRSTLDQALRHAVVSELLPFNPMSVTERPEPKPRKKPVSLTVDQLNVFRAEFATYAGERSGAPNRRTAQLAADIIIGVGGIRVGEALALRPVDVDFAGAVVDVNGTVVAVPSRPTFRQDMLKAARQERFVQVADDGIAMRAFRAALDERTNVLDAEWCRDTRAEGDTQWARELVGNGLYDDADAQDEFRDWAMEHDASDPVRDLDRNTPDQLVQLSPGRMERLRGSEIHGAMSRSAPRSMSRATAWIALGAVTVVLDAGLLRLAQFRYAVALVDPPLPTPDYGLQTLIAYLGAAGVLVGFVTVAVWADRSSSSRIRIVGLGAVSIVGIGSLAAALALTLPTIR